jgi:hypothetical protein
VKALALLQPWACAVIYYRKDIENRGRKDAKMPSALCSHRGSLLVHASASRSRRYEDDAHAWIREHCGIDMRGDPRLEQRGGIIGVVEQLGHLVPAGDGALLFTGGVHGARTARLPFAGLGDHRWHMKGSFGLGLFGAQPLPFLPWKGRLGLFDVPDGRIRWTA